MRLGFATAYLGFLQSRGLQHGEQAKACFVAEHREVFGWNYQVVLNGYRAWLSRNVLADEPEAFTRFCAARWVRHTVKKYSWIA